MGRLIVVDVEKLKELLNDNKIELTNNIISIVRENYIPKADYEARLKADMVAMLEKLEQDLKAEAYGIEMFGADLAVDVPDIEKVIQQKINELEEQ